MIVSSCAQGLFQIPKVEMKLSEEESAREGEVERKKEREVGKTVSLTVWVRARAWFKLVDTSSFCVLFGALTHSLAHTAHAITQGLDKQGAPSRQQMHDCDRAGYSLFCCPMNIAASLLRARSIEQPGPELGPGQMDDNLPTSCEDHAPS